MQGGRNQTLLPRKQSIQESSVHIGATAAQDVACQVTRSRGGYLDTASPASSDESLDRTDHARCSIHALLYHDRAFFVKSSSSTLFAMVVSPGKAEKFDRLTSPRWRSIEVTLTSSVAGSCGQSKASPTHRSHRRSEGSNRHYGRSIGQKRRCLCPRPTKYQRTHDKRLLRLLFYQALLSEGIMVQ